MRAQIGAIPILGACAVEPTTLNLQSRNINMLRSILQYKGISCNNNSNNKQVYLQLHRVGFKYTVHTSI